MSAGYDDHLSVTDCEWTLPRFDDLWESPSVTYPSEDGLSFRNSREWDFEDKAPLQLPEKICKLHGVRLLLVELCVLKPNYRFEEFDETPSAVSYLVSAQDYEDGRLLKAWTDSIREVLEENSTSNLIPLPARPELYNEAYFYLHYGQIAEDVPNDNIFVPDLKCSTEFRWKYHLEDELTDEAASVGTARLHELLEEFRTRFKGRVERQGFPWLSKQLFSLVVPFLRHDEPRLPVRDPSSIRSPLHPAGAVFLFGCLENQKSENRQHERVTTIIRGLALALRAELYIAAMREAKSRHDLNLDRVKEMDNLGHIFNSFMDLTGWSTNIEAINSRLDDETDELLKKFLFELRSSFGAFAFFQGLLQMMRIRGILGEIGWRGGTGQKRTILPRECVDEASLELWRNPVDEEKLAEVRKEFERAISMILEITTWTLLRISGGVPIEIVFSSLDHGTWGEIWCSTTSSPDQYFPSIGSVSCPPFRRARTPEGELPICVLASALIEPIKNAVKYINDSAGAGPGNGSRRIGVKLTVRPEKDDDRERLGVSVKIENALFGDPPLERPSGLSLTAELLKELKFAKIDASGGDGKYTVMLTLTPEVLATRIKEQGEMS